VNTKAIIAIVAVAAIVIGGGVIGAVTLGAAGGNALNSIDWETADNGRPTLTFDVPFSVEEEVVRVVSRGDGDDISQGDSLVLDYTLVSGQDASELGSTYDFGQGEILVVEPGNTWEVLYDALVDSRQGAQILVAYPDQTQVPVAGVYPSFVLAITVTDILPAPLDGPSGTPVEPEAGLPTVTEGADGAPSVSFESAVLPDSLVVQPLVVGEGATVAEGNTVVVNYEGVLWNGARFDSSFANGQPATFQLLQGALIDGWVQGLAGQTVGSRVMLVIPPELGYGDSGAGESIPPGATLVFVVDILAAY